MKAGAQSIREQSPRIITAFLHPRASMILLKTGFITAPNIPLELRTIPSTVPLPSANQFPIKKLRKAVPMRQKPADWRISRTTSIGKLLRKAQSDMPAMETRHPARTIVLNLQFLSIYGMNAAHRPPVSLLIVSARETAPIPVPIASAKEE